MKKIKVIVGAILRGALLLAPGVGAGFYFWGKAPAFIAILATLGLEAVVLFLWSIITVTVQTYRDEKKKKELDEAEDADE